VLEDKVEHDDAVNTFFDTIETDPDKWLTLPENFEQKTKMWVRSVGQKDGRAAMSSCWFIPIMWNVGGYFLRSVGLVAAVRKIIRGETGECGVFTAEKAFEPQAFFAEVVDLLPEIPSNGRLINESFELLP